MKFNVGDKVVMPIEGNKIGIITSTEIESYSNTEYYVIDAGEELPYRYYEKDLKPFVVAVSEKKFDKILLVEDGSVDVEKLEQDGFYCIVYRQGANKPEWL